MSQAMRDRLNYIIEQLEHNNARQFAKKIGVDAGYLSKVRNGIKPIGNHLISKIENTYPQINSSWLKLGIGQPGDISIDAVKTRYEEKILAKDRVIKTLCDELETQRKVIEQLIRLQK